MTVSPAFKVVEGVVPVPPFVIVTLVFVGAVGILNVPFVLIPVKVKGTDIAVGIVTPSTSPETVYTEVASPVDPLAQAYPVLSVYVTVILSPVLYLSFLAGAIGADVIVVPVKAVAVNLPKLLIPVTEPAVVFAPGFCYFNIFWFSAITTARYNRGNRNKCCDPRC